MTPVFFIVDLMDFKGLSDPVVIFNKPVKRSLFDKIRPPSTNFFKGKKYLGGILSVLMLFAIGLGVFLAQRPTQLTPQAESTIDNGLISEWKFDEISGDAAVDSKGVSNGTATNVAIIEGKFDKARQIAAENSKITVPDVQAYAVNFFTVAGWVKPQSFGVGNFSSIFSRRNAANNQGLTLEYSGYEDAGNGQLQCVVFLTGGEPNEEIRVASTNTFKLNLNEWNHVACSYDGSAVNVYINGVLAGSAAKTGTMENGSGMEIKIGQNLFDTTKSLNGTIDQLGYWGRALTDSEIQTLAGIQSSSFCSSNQDCPTGYYCPDLGAQPSGVAVDRVCTAEASPSPSPSGSCTTDAQCAGGMTCQFLNTPNNCPDNQQTCEAYLNSLPKVCKAAASPTASIIVDASTSPSPSTAACTTTATSKNSVVNSGASITWTYTYPASTKITSINFPAKTGMKYSMNGQTSATGQPLAVNLGAGQSTFQFTLMPDTACSPFTASFTMVNSCGTNMSDLVGMGTATAYGSVCAAASPSPLPSASPSPLASTFPQGKGDGNDDGVIDLVDLSILLSKWSPAINITSHFKLDFDDNLRINSIDRSYMIELLKSLGIIKS